LHVPEGPHPRVTHNTPFRAGKGYLYEGGLRVPLIVRGPGLATRQVIDAPLVNTDWMPTLLELAGATPPKNVDGISQARLLRTGKPSSSSRTFFWHIPHYTNQAAVRPAPCATAGGSSSSTTTPSALSYSISMRTSPTRDLSALELARATALRQRLRD
jgi:hypothetical protein